MPHLLRACGLCLLLVLTASAAPPEPPAPAAWNVQIRYRIVAFGSERVRQYRDMLAVFKAAGFQRDADEEVPDNEAENPRTTRMRGTVPARGVQALLKERHVRSLLLSPRSAKLPEKGTRVRVDLILPAGYLPAAQRDLARQTAEVLAKGAGFVEAVGYDQRGFTRLLGSVPVENLERLLEGPAQVAAADKEGPARVRRLQDLALIVARPDLPLPKGRPAVPKVPAAQEKFDPALRSLLGGGAAKTRGRLEVILGHTPRATENDWLVTLAAVPGVTVEGRMGPLVTVAGVPGDIAPRLAALPEVAAVRLPRLARHAPPGPKGEVPAKWERLRASGLTRLHELGMRGRGTRIVLVSDDFHGWETLKGRKDGKIPLPDPVLVDLTAERNRDLRPDPFPSASKDVAQGHGTRCAVTLLRAAPEAELTLVRIDAAAPYMLEELARAINGESVRSISLDARFRDLRAERRRMQLRRDDLTEERRAALDDFSEDEAAVKRRKEYRARQAAFERDEAALGQRERRLLNLADALNKLRGVRLVASGLVWVDGHPVDGSGALSRYFDDRPFKAALWFQAAGDTRGQAWSGLFHDRDGNGWMEFADPAERLPPGSWTPELNFLAWQGAGERATRFLPAGTPLRLSLQWREPHDPLPLRVGDDVYREPLAKFRLVLVRQLDPDGKAQPADDLEVVAQSAGPPQRLNQMLNSATYEITLELALPVAGRYAVFVEGNAPDSLQAPGEANLPITKKRGEIRPRLFVHTLQGTGRAVWRDFVTASASLGMPADARRVITVGAADARDRPRPTTPVGSPLGQALVNRPDVLAYDEGGGSEEAACFAAGFIASSWGSRGTLFGAVERLCPRPGQVLRVPEAKR